MESRARAEADKASRTDAEQEKAVRLEETYRKLVLVTKAYQDKEKQVAEAVSTAAGLDDRVSSLQAELETAKAAQHAKDSVARDLQDQLRHKQAEHQQQGGLMAQLERQAEDALAQLNECRSDMLVQTEAKVRAGSELMALQARFADVERQNDLLTETIRAQGEQLKKTSNIAQLIHNLSAAAGTPVAAADSSNITLPAVNEGYSR
jgi:chromosome segregation ATPase